jgi:hypothetical protein
VHANAFTAEQAIAIRSHRCPGPTTQRNIATCQDRVAAREPALMKGSSTQRLTRPLPPGKPIAYPPFGTKSELMTLWPGRHCAGEGGRP